MKIPNEVGGKLEEKERKKKSVTNKKIHINIGKFN